MGLKDSEIEKKVILLKLLVKEKDESIEDALISLADTKMATLDEIKSYIVNFKRVVMLVKMES